MPGHAIAIAATTLVGQRLGPLIYLFIYVLQLEDYFIWWATALQYAFSALLLYVRYRRKRWG